jgi:hypothetical protein
MADHPFFIPMPVWGRPGLLTGKQPTTEFGHYKAHVFYSVPPNIKQTLALADGLVAELPFPEFRINHNLYARGIAKIAYCDAVDRFGLHAFRRLVLPDLILGRYPCIPYFVGCRLDDPPPPTAREVLHAITLGHKSSMVSGCTYRALDYSRIVGSRSTDRQSMKSWSERPALGQSDRALDSWSAVRPVYPLSVLVLLPSASHVFRDGQVKTRP